MEYNILIKNKKRIACDQIFPEKVVNKNVNIVKTKFWFDDYNGNFGKMVEADRSSFDQKCTKISLQK